MPRGTAASGHGGDCRRGSPEPKQLEREAERFRTWTGRTRQPRANWGACYPHWDRICAALERTLADGCLSPPEADTVLELMVHDRQRERIIERVGAHPMLAFQIATRGAGHVRAEVRWSVMPLLGRLGSLGAVEILHQLCHDPEPAIRRRARSTLATIDPGFDAADDLGLRTDLLEGELPTD